MALIAGHYLNELVKQIKLLTKKNKKLFWRFQFEIYDEFVKIFRLKQEGNNSRF